MEEIPRHQCVIYDGSPARLLPAIAAHITQRLGENLRCLYLNSPAMVAGVRSYLFAAGVDPGDEVAKGRLILTSEQSQITDGHFDASVMIRQLEEAVSQAVKDGFDGLWATGDMGWEMGRDRDLKKLVDYEYQLEKLFQKHTMLYGLCQYHQGTLSKEAVCNGLVSHPAIFINETLARLNPHYHPSQSSPELVPVSAALSHTVQNLCAIQPPDAPDTNQAF